MNSRIREKIMMRTSMSKFVSNKFILKFLSLSTITLGLFLGEGRPSYGQGGLRYVQMGRRCQVYQIVGGQWRLVNTFGGSCPKQNNSSNTGSSQSSNTVTASSSGSLSNYINPNTMNLSSGLLSVDNAPSASSANATRIGYIWEYYPQNSTCHLVRYLEYNNTDPTIYNKYRYIRQVIEGYSNISNELCGLKSIYGKTIYTSVNLNDSRWQWGYNPSNRQWQWNYQ